MGINSGKFYDAKKTAAYFDNMRENALIYGNTARDVAFSYDAFVGNETYKGELADSSKMLVKGGLEKLLKETLDIHDYMLKVQEAVMNTFEAMVDPSLQARIEYDTMEIIDKDFKGYHTCFKPIAGNVRKIVDSLQDEFGDYASFPQPDSKTARASFVQICGGDQAGAGYFKECQGKLVEYDAEMNRKLKTIDIPDHAKSIVSRVNTAGIGLLALAAGEVAIATKAFSAFMISILNNMEANTPVYDNDGEQVVLARPDNVADSRIGDGYSNVLYVPQHGEVIEVSLGTDHVPPRQTAAVSRTNCWSIEYTIEGANSSYPPSGYRSTRVLNDVVERYDTNAGENDLLKVNIPEYGECYAGAMISGFGNMGDVVEVTLDNGETFKMVLVDTKNNNHTDQELPGTQCQNYWGHGYILESGEVQVNVCEFVAAGSDLNYSAKDYPSGQEMLDGRSVVSAEVVGHIDVCA